MATRCVFVARFTECPEYDIERGWSAWMDYDGETKGELIDSYRSEHPDANVRKLRVGYHKFYKRWVVIHHKGLSCFALSSSTAEAACEEAVKKFENGEIEWEGFGQVTVGKVSLVRRLPQANGSLCIFSCESTYDEGGQE
jgi:hypothetical protein